MSKSARSLGWLEGNEPEKELGDEVRGHEGRGGGARAGGP